MAKRKYNSPILLGATTLSGITLTPSQEGTWTTGGGTAYEQIRSSFDCTDDEWDQIMKVLGDWSDYGYDEDDWDTWDTIMDEIEKIGIELGIFDW